MCKATARNYTLLGKSKDVIGFGQVGRPRVGRPSGKKNSTNVKRRKKKMCRVQFDSSSF